MTDEVKRGPGRPPKVRPEATPVPKEQELTREHGLNGSMDEVQRTREHELANRMVEVELIRKYAPLGQKTEIQKTVPPGTVMLLPVLEATRVLKLGVARGTDHTFG